MTVFVNGKGGVPGTAPSPLAPLPEGEGNAEAENALEIGNWRLEMPRVRGGGGVLLKCGGCG